MSSYGADVIGFQEYTSEWEPYIKQYFGEEYEIFNKYRAEENLESTPILWKKSKFNCIKKGYFWLSDTPEVESKGWDEIGCFRICIYAILQDKESGEKFTFMNTHFGFGDKCQTDSTNLIYDYSKKISDYPTFITGDFNMTPDSIGYKAMTKKFTDVNAVTANDHRTTYHNYKPEEITDQHIDYCFIDKNILPINQKIIDDMIDNRFPSDHYGLYIKIKLPM